MASTTRPNLARLVAERFPMHHPSCPARNDRGPCLGCGADCTLCAGPVDECAQWVSWEGQNVLACMHCAIALGVLP